MVHQATGIMPMAPTFCATIQSVAILLPNALPRIAVQSVGIISPPRQYRSMGNRGAEVHYPPRIEDTHSSTHYSDGADGNSIFHA